MATLVVFVLFVLINVAAASAVDKQQPFLCADGSRPVQCFVEPCAFTKCDEYPNAKCEDDYCGGCKARFYEIGNNKEVTGDCTQDKQPTLSSNKREPFLCADGSHPFECFVEPCAVTKCGKHPSARCEDDYCGGCKAKFYVNKTEVTHECDNDNQPFVCADGSPIVECFAEPCAVTICGKHPNARCEDDYCGGCNARFYDGNNKEVTGDCAQVDKRAVCPGGLAVVKCLIEPCAVNKCENYPTALCIDDYCGGCHARYFVDADEVTSDCRAKNQPQLCVDGSSPFNCFVQPCLVSKCRKYKDAKCINDYCGGCGARYIVNGTEVTGACDEDI